MLQACLTTILFSLSAVFGRKTTEYLGGTEANFWRLVIATALLAIFSHTLGHGLHGAAFYLFFISGAIGFGIGDLALFQAYPRLGSRLTMVIVHCIAAPMGSIIEFIWMGTTLTGKQTLAAGIILGGVALALVPNQMNMQVKGQIAAGAMFGLIAAFGQAMGAVISRKAYAVGALDPAYTEGITAGINGAYQRILGGLLVSGLFLLWVKRKVFFRPDQVTSNWRKAWPYVLCNALAGPALGVSAYQWALKTTPTGVVLPIVAITPVVVIPLAWWMEKERPQLRSIIGGLIAVGGAVFLAMAT